MRVTAWFLATLLTLAPAQSAPSTLGEASGATPLGVVSYVAPLTGGVQVVRPFQPPATRYGPGHRGVDLASHEGEAVQAAGTGTVTFSGRLAGRGVIVIAHADGVRTEYEPVLASVHVGDVVAGGQRIGTVWGAHGTCLPGGCLHWGARRGDVYFDPLQLLRPLGVVRLLPDLP